MKTLKHYWNTYPVECSSCAFLTLGLVPAVVIGMVFQQKSAYAELTMWLGLAVILGVLFQTLASLHERSGLALAVAVVFSISLGTIGWSIERCWCWLPACMPLVTGMVVQRFTSYAGHNLKAMWAALIVGGLLLSGIDTTAAERPVQPFPGYGNSYETSVNISLPPIPGQERGALVGGACVLVLAVVVGFVVIKIKGACARIDNAVSNRNNQAEFLLSNVNPVVSPTGSTPPPDTRPCEMCTEVGPVEGQPLPILVEHSFDRETWSTIARGTAVGSELQIPDKGFWRMSALPLSIAVAGNGSITVQAPPGILDYSENLSDWTTLQTNYQDTTLEGAPPGFYRVRLN